MLSGVVILLLLLFFMTATVYSHYIFAQIQNYEILRL